MLELACNESLVRLQSTEISEAGNQNYIVGRSSMAVVFSVGTTFCYNGVQLWQCS
jgi:hypothetical protein